MKKKVISAVLLAVMTLATTSTFVSCKDYSDDISDLQGQLVEETLKSTTLEARLRSTKEALEEQLTELQSFYATQLSEATTALQTAINEKADATVVTELADRVVTLNSDLAAAKSSLQAQITTCDNAIQSINTALAGKASVAELNAAKAQAAADLAALSGNVDQFVEQLNNLAAETNTNVATILASLATLQSKDTELANKDNEILSTVSQNYQTLLNKIAEEKQAAIDAANAKISQEEATRIAAINDLTTQVQALQTFQAAILASDFQTQISDLATALSNFQGEVATADFQGQINTTNASVTAVQNDIATLSAKISANEISISQLQTEMATVNNALTNINAEIASLKVLIEKSLTSLVFKPTQYIYGFGAINVMSFEDCKLLKKQNVNNTTYGVNGQIEEYVLPTTGVTKSTWVPSVHARYHMNPSTADYTKYTYTFADVETQNVLTRANDEQPIGATAGTVTAANGVLDVEVNIGLHTNLNDAVAQPGGFAWVSTLALEATEKNTDPAKKITSDYALVVPNYYDNLCLANNQATTLDHVSGDYVDPSDPTQNGNNKSHHIRTSALNTITDDVVTFEVPYNGELDLSQYIETHYGVSPTAAGTKVGCKAFTAAEFAASGLKYNYALVSYKKAGSSTNQATIAEISEAGVTKVKNNDAQYIGETYVVRILLQDGHNKIVAVGYVKILVVDQGAQPASVTTGIALNCENPTTTSVAMSEFVDQFKDSYSSSLTINDFKGSKYLLDSNVYSDKSSTPALFGKGTFSLSGNNLVLSFTSAEAKQLFYMYDVVVPQTIKVYAKFAHQNDGYSDLWVEFTIDKDQIIYAQGTFADKDKIKAYWYELNSKTKAEDNGNFDEIHANASVPETGDANPTFNFNVLNTFVGQKAYIDGINPILTTYTADPYADLTIANSDFNKRVVTGTSGDRYQLVVVDKKTLAAYKVGEPSTNAQNVVVLSDTYFGTANYQKLDYAKDILNYASHNELGANETFAIEIQLEQNRNCYNVELTDNTFQIKFLRPINTTDLDAPATTDAVHGGGYWYVQDLVEFTDWRDYKFNTYPQFYNFYGVTATSIVPRWMDTTDPNKIVGCTTDINGNPSDLLTAVAPGIELTWDGTAVNSIINGKITYINNGATVNQVFHIFVPMAITYEWGTIFTNVKLTIQPTIHNQKK